MNWLHACVGRRFDHRASYWSLILSSYQGGSWQSSYIRSRIMGVFAFRPCLSCSPCRCGRSRVKDGDAKAISVLRRPPLTESLRQPDRLDGSCSSSFIYGGVEIGTGQLANTLLVDGSAAVFLKRLLEPVGSAPIGAAFTVGRILDGFAGYATGRPHLSSISASHPTCRLVRFC